MEQWTREEQLGVCFRRIGDKEVDEVRLDWKDVRLEGKINATW